MEREIDLFLLMSTIEMYIWRYMNMPNMALELTARRPTESTCEHDLIESSSVIRRGSSAYR